MDVFRHILDLKQSEPSQKWRARSRTLIAAIGKEQFFQPAARWLQLGPSPQQSGVQLNGKESDYQKGFLWFLAESDDPELCRLVSRFAEASLKKIRMLGAVSQKVGNACVNVLAEMPGLEPVMQLSGLARRIRYDTAQRLIEQALEQAAKRAGVSRDQLEEMTVPDFGLDPGGTRTEQFGEYSAHLAIELSTSVHLTWTDQEGKSLKSVPAAVKQQHAEDLKALQSTAKEMERMLASHRIRVERLLLTQRAIPLDSWRAYYLDHPLMSDMSRRLIWQFDSPAGNSLGIWRANKIVDLRGSEIDFPAETRSASGTPSNRMFKPSSTGAAGSKTTRSRNPSNRLIAKYICSPMPSAKQATSQTVSPDTFSASTNFRPFASSAVGSFA